MSRNWFCDQCEKEATAFALQPPLKLKACSQHAVALIQKHSSVFDIAAFDFVEQAEDYPDYLARQEKVQKLKSCFTVLKERCESNRREAHSRLQTAKEALHATIERTFQELCIQLEQRCQRLQEELDSLSVSAERCILEKYSTLETFDMPTPAKVLFRVCVGDCSLEVVKAVLGSVLLLPSEEGIPSLDTGEKLVVYAQTQQADLAEEIYEFALNLGCSNSDFKTAADTLRRKSAKQLLLALPWTATEPQVREVVNSYIQKGAKARVEGNYEKSLKQLEKGEQLLQLWGLESAEMCAQLGVVYHYFGRKEEACAVLRQGLMHSSAALSLKLQRSLIEIFYQAGDYTKAAEEAELALASEIYQCDSFETLQILCFLVRSQFKLKKTAEGFALVNYWTKEIVAVSAESQAILQFVFAENEIEKGCKRKAAELYEKGLETLVSPYHLCYLAVLSRQDLGWLYEALNQPKPSLSNYFQSIELFQAHFPLSLGYARCLHNLGHLYHSENNDLAAENQYIQAIALYSRLYADNLNHAHCLKNLAELRICQGRAGEAIDSIEKAVRIYTQIGDLEDANYCKLLLP